MYPLLPINSVAYSTTLMPYRLLCLASLVIARALEVVGAVRVFILCFLTPHDVRQLFNPMEAAVSNPWMHSLTHAVSAIVRLVELAVHAMKVSVPLADSCPRLVPLAVDLHKTLSWIGPLDGGRQAKMQSGLVDYLIGSCVVGEL